MPDQANDVECTQQAIATDLVDVALLPLAEAAALPSDALRHGLRRILNEIGEPVAAFQNSIV